MSLLLLAVVGCDKEEPVVEPELTIEITDYAIDAAEGSSATATFEVNVAWTASVTYASEADKWLTVTPTSGDAGKQTIRMTATANTTEAVRTAYVVIEYGAKLVRLTVEQAGQEAGTDDPDDPEDPDNPDDPAEGTDITADFDPLFAQELEARGYVADADHITLEEVEKVTELNLGGGTMTSLRGVEHFKALTYLDCHSSQLANLDLSANTLLEVLYCYTTQLTDLDLSANTALKELICVNNDLTSLNVKGCSSLVVLRCWKNQLTSLDVSGCSLLEELTCYDNQLMSLDLSSCSSLTELDCSENQLSTLDLNDCVLLTSLECLYNQLTSLDISANTLLTSLICDGNPGDGSVFPVTAWFDNENVPEGFSQGSWYYEEQTITIDYRKKN